MSVETTTNRAINFSAGPAVLPVSVLRQIQDDMLALPGIGSSILEISHRSPAFVAILEDAKSRIIDLMDIPETHDVLFLQGGGRLQNAMIPMNFFTDSSQTADYIVTGNWGKNSAAEVHRFGNLNLAYNGADSGFNHLPSRDEINFSDNAAYIHYTSNETIHGLQFNAPPANGDAPLISDSSSDFMCRPEDVSKFGLIYACAQKNAGTAGVTICVIRKDLLERSGDLPSYLSYQQVAAKDSMLNTPPTFAIYVTGLVCKWLQEEIGGLEKVHALNVEKSKLLYDAIDNSGGFYTGHAASPDHRSIMNVVFKLPAPELDKQFLNEAGAANLTTLAGHRSIGGVRASIYNAMPREGVEALVTFMQDFSAKNG